MRGHLFQICILAIVCLGFSAKAFADLQPQDLRIWRRADTLVSGQQLWSFQSSYQNISQHYGSGGESEPLGSRLTRKVRWKALLAADPKAQATMQNYMRSHALNENDLAASEAYDVSREELGLGINWAYGLTHSWMIGFEVPTLLRSTRVTQNVNMNASTSAIPGGQQNLAGQVRALATAQLAQAGYAPVPAQKQTFSLGDISLLSRIALASSYSWRWSVQQLVRVPTAQNPSTTDYIDDSRNEGPVNLGASSLVDYHYRRLIMGGRLGYTAQLPDQVRMRLNGNAVDPTVSRKLGDYYWVAGDAEYRATEHLSVTLGYSFLEKAKDSYNRGGDPNFDYSALGDDTDQELHQSRVGFFYTIDGTHDGRAGLSERWLVGMDYIYPWIGRNAIDAARTSLEVTNYF